MEKYGTLLNVAVGTDGRSSLRDQLNKIFLKANDKYNSGLFKPEKWISDLDIDDKIFQNIIKYLYYPDCPYELSVLPIEILGNIYEQFLGKTIRLTSSHQAKVEEKEEVRKAGGVYYTPQYIVNYIVENTIGEMLRLRSANDKTFDLYDHPKLTILDPACGSGSFLVGAYSFLLDRYLESYTDKKRLQKSLKNGLIYQVSENTYRLSITVKQHILLHHIYGVDIDYQAVEVTKLSLLLKLMEDENTESADRLFKHSDVKLLPDLQNNIKCGNSLIGSDFYNDKNLSLFGKEEMRKVNVFDWEKEFAEVFPSTHSTGSAQVPLKERTSSKGKNRSVSEVELKNQGFDIIIGNPPYVRQETLGEEFKIYAKSHYKNTFAGTADLYVYFIEKSLSLLAENGLYSIIVANKWMRANYGEALRKFLKTKRIFEIVDFGDLPVFKNATTYPCIIKANNNKPQNIQTVQIKDLNFPSLIDLVKKDAYQVDVNSLDDKGWSLSNQKESALLDKIKKAGIPLGEYVEGKIYYGIKTGLNEAFVIDEETKNRLIKEDKKSAEIIKPFLVGREIKRYTEAKVTKYLLFIPWHFPLHKDKSVIGSSKNAETAFKNSYPAIYKHLSKYKKELENRNKAETGIRYEWYALQRCANTYYEEFDKEKIIYAEISIRGSFTMDSLYNFTDTTSFIIPINSKYLLGLLNSNLFSFVFKKYSSEIRGGFLRWKGQYMSQIPIPKSPNAKTKSDIEKLVEQMLSTQKHLQKANTESDKKLLQQKCDLLDKQIDKLVYELYGLTEEEIKIVEGDDGVLRFLIRSCKKSTKKHLYCIQKWKNNL